MIVSIASGKGGTGKTTIAVNLALALENAQIVDCDVEEPNAHIFLKPGISSAEDLTVRVPRIDRAKCDFCEACAEACAFRAMNVFKPLSGGWDVLFLPELCHSCGACALACPKGAISETRKKIGVIETGRAGNLDYACGRLNIGEPKAPPLIKALKKKINRSKTVILDCPPGTSCPMMTAVKGSDFCLLVTEPTPFGLHDLKLAVETVRKLGIRHGVFINRADDSKMIDAYCTEAGVPLLGRLPFDREIAALYSKGLGLLSDKPQYIRFFRELADKIGERIRHAITEEP
ncbi:MAG: P-loop NTPase [Elusimicrobia bacterium]|nr:P-loop NTPase [Elusimicrobiota bacterium]